MRKKHDPNIKKFKCELCCLVFVKESTLKTHNCRQMMCPRYRKVPMTCAICGTILSSKRALQIHQSIMHNLSEFKFCSVCYQKFSNTDDLDAHRKECKIAQKTKILRSKAFSELGCFICNTMFKSNKLLHNHIETKHTNCKTFACSLCQMIFMKEFSLRLHICKPKRDNSVSCDICGKELA